MESFIKKFLQKRVAAVLLIAGIACPLWLFFFNFSWHLISHKASLPVEVLVITKKGTYLNNLCKISPSGKIDSFYCAKPNYFTREDEWGLGRGYVKTIAVGASEVKKIHTLFLRCGDHTYSWSGLKIESEWKQENGNFVLANVPSEAMPFYRKVMNYEGNAEVIRKIFVPTLLMSVVLLSLTFVFYQLYKNYLDNESFVQNVSRELFATGTGKLFSWTCIASIVVFYLYNYFTLAPYIHAETFTTFPRLANSEGESFFGSLAEKSFDLSRVEEGGYRPRALAFIIGYTDTNSMIWLNQKFPAFGPRLPFMLVAASLLVFATFRLARTLFPKIPVETALIIACSMLFFQNFQTTTYLYLRSAKALCPGVCVLLLDFYFRHHNKPAAKSFLRAMMAALVIFIVSTIDEQIIAALLLVLLLACIDWFYEKKPGFVFYSSAMALGLYVIFYLLADSLLFARYTTAGVHPHDHRFTDIFYAFGLENLQRAGEIWAQLLLALSSSWILFIPMIGITSVFWVKLSVPDKIRSGLIFCFSLLLVAGVIGSHRTAYFCREIWNGAYFLPAACLMLAAILFTWSRPLSQSASARAPILITCAFLISFFINSLRVDIFYNNYTSVEAGERGAMVDVKDWMNPFDAKYFEGARKPALQLEKYAAP